MTKKEYLDYQERVADFFERQRVENLSADSDSEPYFSWRPCDCCNRPLGGDRYPATGYNREAGEVYEFEVCPDCVYYAEYGQLDDQTMLDIERSEN